MRLVCPNCSAQYEIDGSMIPDDGRDVQCSNCGHTWFELPGPSEAGSGTGAGLETGTSDSDDLGTPPQYDPDEEDAFDEASEETLTSRAETRPTNLSRADFEDEAATTEESGEDTETDNEAPVTDGGGDSVTAAVEAITAAAEDRDIEDADQAGDEQAADEPVEDDEDDISAVAAAGTPRRPADAAALDILREEAERELSQRRAPPSGPIETQTDLGLEDIRDRRTPSRALRARMAHLGEESPEEEPIEAPDNKKSRLISNRAPLPHDDDEAYEEPRRDLLPDIEEINSTLKAAPPGQADTASLQRSGFRIGFLLMVFLTCAAIFAYAQAPAIARALPETEGSLISYVDWANGVRDWVDGLIGN